MQVCAQSVPGMRAYGKCSLNDSLSIPVKAPSGGAGEEVREPHL